MPAAHSTSKTWAPHSLTTFETASLTVVIEEGPESGRVVHAEIGRGVRYAVTGNREEFEGELLDVLNGRR